MSISIPPTEPRASLKSAQIVSMLKRNARIRTHAPGVSLTFLITLFRSGKADKKIERNMTLRELAELFRGTNANGKTVDKAKARLPWFKLARFGNTPSEKNCFRYNDNVLSITGIEGDYDGGKITLDEAVAIARKAGIAALFYTSASYTDERPRWRIVLPTSTELPPERRTQLMARVNGLYGGALSGESFTLSQSYYFGSVNGNPAHRVEIAEGDCIDLRNDLDAGAIGKHGKEPNGAWEPMPSSNLVHFDEFARGDSPSLEKVEAALRAYPNTEAVDRAKWVEVGFMVKSAFPGDEGWTLYRDWTKTWEGWGTPNDKGAIHEYDEAAVLKTWKSFKPDHRITVASLFHLANEASPGWWPPRAPAAPPTGRLMQTSGQFVGGFMPPDYLVDGLLQRRYVYSLTAPTGSGKTAIALRIAAHVALGLPLADREVDRGRVLFFAGENPDDVRTRWIMLCEEMGVNPESLDVVFMPFTVNLSEKQIRKRIDEEAAEFGPFALLIIDTSASYYSGNDENDNVALGNHARMLRTFVDLPGGPAILVTCHPVKTPNMDNLLPRGGGAFLAEVDGNLVCIKDAGTMTVEMTTHGKFRGPDFAPFSFKLVAGQSEKLVDTKGRSIWSIFARPVSKEELETIKEIGVSDQDDLLRIMLTHPGKPLHELAVALQWTTDQGEPNRQKVHRVMMKLKTAKLVEQGRDERYGLTKKGEDEAAQLPPLAAWPAPEKPSGKGVRI